MRAAVVTALDGPDSVELREVPEPLPAQDQIMVDVEYAGVAFPDVLLTRGQYQLRPEPPFSPGWEVSGVVRADGGGFLSLIHISEPTRRTPISYAVFCLKK